MKKRLLVSALVLVMALAGLMARTVVIAGGTGEIGSGNVINLARNGVNVVLETHNPAGAAALIEAAEGLPGTVKAMSSDTGYDELFQAVAEEFGAVDGLIITTGDMDAAKGIEELEIEELRARLENKIVECFMRVQAAVPYLKAAGNSRIILNSCSGAMDGNLIENTFDEVCGGALISMTYALARELAAEGVTVNCIARSGMINDHTVPGKLDIADYVDKVPAGSAGTSDDYASLVEYIISEESRFVTGNVFNLSGGLYIGR